MLQQLFPAGVVTVDADAADLWQAPLVPEEAVCVASAVPGRRREFAVGRACARRGLAVLGLSAQPIARGEDRAPLWPEDATGSITHCREFCGAAVARRSQFRALGLDAERTGRVTPAILERISSGPEREALARFAASTGEADAGTLLWCAKESVLKCLSVATGRLPGPRDVAIAFEAHRFLATPVSGALVRAGVPTLRGCHAVRGSLVLAGTSLAAGAVP